MVGKVMTVLALTAMIGSVAVAPASAGDRDHREGHGHRDNGHFGRGGHGYDRGRHYEGRRGYRSYGYVEPVYVAPPVYYAPEPAPGVSIFLPTIHIR